MRVLVFGHRFEAGGSQRTAIDLSVALRDSHGHDVTIFATPGPMVSVAEQLGLRFIAAPHPTKVPSRLMISALRSVIREQRPDVIHVWDWWQAVDAFFAADLGAGVPLVVSDSLSDRLVRVLPKHVLTTYGTPELVDRARAVGRSRVALLVPPVDVISNAAGVVDPRPFRERHAVRDEDIVVVTVSRLVEQLKGESLRGTIEAIRCLGREVPVRFFMVGDGPARASLERLAADADRAIGRRAVTLTGELLDPREAYAAADLVVGMGGSALRGMALGKAVLIVGEKGFSLPFTPDTSAAFYYFGMYGIGDGRPAHGRLISDLRLLLGSRSSLREMGAYSRQFVTKHFALDVVAAELNGYLHRAVQERRRRSLRYLDAVRTGILASLVRLARGRDLGPIEKHRVAVAFRQ